MLAVMWNAHVNTDIYNRLEISWWWNKQAESTGNWETKLAQWCKLGVYHWTAWWFQHMCRMIFEKCIQPRPSVSIISISGDRNSWCQRKDLAAEVQRAESTWWIVSFQGNSERQHFLSTDTFRYGRLIPCSVFTWNSFLVWSHHGLAWFCS